MSSSAGGLVVFLLSVQVIQSQDGWGVTYRQTEVCAVKGSEVEINCTYTHPPGIRYNDIKDRFWFTKEKDGEPVDLRTDSEYSGRVEFECSKTSCYLIIRNLRESDSAEYKLTFRTNKGEKYTGSPGVTLSVTDPDLQVQVSRSDSTWLELTCHSSCDLSHHPGYNWYKNEEYFKTGSSLLVSSGSTDRYSCGLRGSSGHRSPAVYGPQRPSVSASPSAEMMEGGSVTLTCSADANPAANYTWYKEDEDSPHASGQMFTITDFRAEHIWNYSCEAQNQMGRSTSTLLLTISSGNGGCLWSIITAVASTSAVFLVIIMIIPAAILIFLYIRRIKSGQSRRPEERPENNEIQLMTAEQQEEEKKKKKEEELEEEEEEKNYEVSTCIHFDEDIECEGAVDDSSALYSTVSKAPRE
ncbi:carcinoembryonic antigen-related cell adhesion molecule 20-like isoform X2 [Pungitius pungitius]|uniref:carcinoembryonic antigen-related cell adhesion molecule 20-like isoform X2 n=1 Tax=Pungitius pungitius TaxID=134920 RepID=UPI002E145268